MALIRRRAFTVVDMLVVICGTGMMMSLLLPDLAIIAEKGRRVDCANREKQIAMAALVYQVDFKAFPGYWMAPSMAKQTGTTWPLALTKYLGREDLWNAWNDNKIPSSLYWDQVVCPSNIPKNSDAHWLSYVVNCGLFDNNSNRADGVCFNQLTKPAGPKTTTDFLMTCRGDSYTLFASENTLGIASANTDGWLQTTPAGALQYTGFCWQAVKEPNAAQKINGDRSNAKPPMPKTKLTDYARPSSNHPGGVNVVFCDGHYHFLREDVAYSVYQTLMAADPLKADFPAGSAAIEYILNDRDY